MDFKKSCKLITEHALEPAAEPAKPTNAAVALLLSRSAPVAGLLLFSGIQLNSHCFCQKHLYIYGVCVFEKGK